MTALKVIQFLLVENWPITAVVVLGIAAIYLLLPRPHAGRRGWPIAGLGIGLVALLLGGWMLLRPGPLAGAAAVEAILFYLFSALAIVSGVLLVTQRNPARAALSFALVVLSTCGLFLLQAAPFLAAATAIVYAGAIVVTFLFVLMLAQQEGPSDADFRSREPFLASVAGFVLLGTLLHVLQTGHGIDEELDELARRARELQQRVQQMREKAKEPGELVEVLKDTQKMLRQEPPGDVERLRLDLRQWAEAKFPGSAWSGPVKEALDDLDKAIVELVPLAKQPENPALAPAAQKGLALLDRALQASSEIRETLGVLQPAGNDSLSEFSGPAANKVSQLRRDEQGRPQMPHENTAYLGRALFTDYLLAVELAGTLLLVATIGAIAIAQSRARPTPEKRT